MCHDIENTEDGDLECERWKPYREGMTFIRIRAPSLVYIPRKIVKIKSVRLLYNKTDNREQQCVQQWLVRNITKWKCDEGRSKFVLAIVVAIRLRAIWKSDPAAALPLFFIIRRAHPSQTHATQRNYFSSIGSARLLY